MKTSFTLLTPLAAVAVALVTPQAHAGFDLYDWLKQPVITEAEVYPELLEPGQVNLHGNFCWYPKVYQGNDSGYFSELSIESNDGSSIVANLAEAQPGVTYKIGVKCPLYGVWRADSIDVAIPQRTVTILGGGHDNVGQNHTTNELTNDFYVYMGPFYHRGETDCNDAKQTMPVGGYLSDLYVKLHDTAGDGDSNDGSWDFTVMVDPDCTDQNNPTGQTPLKCTIGASEEGCEDKDHTAYVAAGKEILVMAKPSCKNSGDPCPVLREMRYTLLLETGLAPPME